MKKILALFLAAFMAIGFAACNKAEDNNSEGGDEFTLSSEEIINSIYEKNPVDLSLETTPIDITDADMLKAFTGLDSADKVKEVYVSEPMMSSQAYSLVVVRVKDKADAEEIASAVLDGINPRKWVCVEADDIRVMTKDDAVVLYMVDSQFGEEMSGDSIEKAFTEVAGGSLDKVIKK